MIRFFVAGIPKSMKVGGIARFQRGGKVHMVPKRANSEWALLVGQIGRAHAPAAPFIAPVRLTATFLMPRPKSAAKRILFPMTRPDLDNCLHKLSDQFNGVFWKDDSQVVDLVATKRFAPEGQAPGLELMIEELVTP